MDFISSKNIFLLVRDTLKLIDKLPMKHGSRTGYILYKMMQCKGTYEKYEMAEFVMLATLHDIGSYKTDLVDDVVRFDKKDSVPHSISGYLFLKYFSPMQKNAKIILYHNLDYLGIKDIEYEYKEIAEYLNLAEKLDLYQDALGKEFDYRTFDRYADKKFSKEALELFDKAQEKYDVFGKIRSEEYETELDELMGYIIFTNEEKKFYLKMLLFSFGYFHEMKVVDAETTMCISEELAKKMVITEKDAEKLYYAAMIHDIGMLAIPRSLQNAKKRLYKSELEAVKEHVEIARKILSNRMDEEIVEIACAHHERTNGLGYPTGMKATQMNRLVKILQVSDVVTAMVNQRPYREPLQKQEVIKNLNLEKEQKGLSAEVVTIMIENYDEIIGEVNKTREKLMSVHLKMTEQYDRLYTKFKQ